MQVHPGNLWQTMTENTFAKGKTETLVGQTQYDDPYRFGAVSQSQFCLGQRQQGGRPIWRFLDAIFGSSRFAIYK